MFYKVAKDFIKALSDHVCECKSKALREQGCNCKSLVPCDDPSKLILGYTCEGCNKSFNIRLMDLRDTQDTLKEATKELIMTQEGRVLIGRVFSL